MTTKMHFLLSAALFADSLAPAHGQTPSSAAAPTATYDPASAAQQMIALKQASPHGEQVKDLIHACEVAADHQDVDTLVLATMGQLHPNGGKRALELIAQLPVALQKRACARILLDEEFWRLDVANGYREWEQLSRQQRARRLISRVLGRDLRTLSKDYDPDPRKQGRAENADFAPMLMSREAREQAARDLSAQ